MTDGPTARYLQPIAGLDAAMWVPPSSGQLFWLRRAPALFAPARGTGRGLVRWWAYWAVKERDLLWGSCAVGLAVALYPLALVLGRLGAVSPWAQPWAWVLLGGALQAGSHILEPLPPRVTRSVHWIAPAEYLLGRAGCRNPLPTVLRRAGQLAAQAAFGTVDEIVASPRLLPVLLLELLWLLGHDPVRRAAWRVRSARAIASGNPALDYIGTGGPTPLRAPA